MSTPAVTRIALESQDEVRIGRDEDSTVVLDDPRVSRRHLRISSTGPASWRVVDLGSRNGTFLDGVPVREVEVTGPVRLRLGHALRGVVVELVPEAAAAATAHAGTATAHAGTETASAPPRVVRIGRGPGNDVVVDHPTVSTWHAEAVFTAAGIEVRDLGSRNGTHVDGAPVRRARVAPGALLTVGAVDLRVGPDGVEVERAASTARGGVVVRGLVVRRGGKTLLDGIDVDMRPGEVTAVVGPSGAGKSTLMAAVTGGLLPSGGSVMVDGHDVATAGHLLRHRIGVVPQEDVLHTSLGVRAGLAYSARLRLPAETTRSQRRAEVARVLTALRLTEHARTRISHLSGGQRKRMNAASELLTRPSLLVLDEPTSGLDPHLERLIMDDLAALAAEGCTVVVVTHSAAVLAASDRVVVISGGSLLYSGPPADLPDHFGARGLSTVFAEVGGPGAGEWAEQWRHGDVDRHREPVSVLPVELDRVPTPHLHHVRTLAVRQVHLLLADRASFALLMVQGPALGLLTRLFPDGGGFVPGPVPNTDVRTVLLVLVLSATWLGVFAAVRQIVDERRVVDRERAAGVSPASYATAKTAVLGLLVVVQVVGLMAAALAGRPLPTGVVIAHPGVELLVVLVLTGWAGVALGLLVSAVARSGAGAAAVAPLIVVPQLLLCGALTPVDEQPVLDAATRVVSARAAFSAAASSTGLVDLEAGPGGATAGEPGAWAPDPTTWWHDVAELAAIALVAWILLLIVLRRRRTHDR